MLFHILLSFPQAYPDVVCESCVFVAQPDNVLLTSNKVLKLADFGLAISINQERPNTRAGTLGECLSIITHMYACTLCFCGQPEICATQSLPCLPFIMR